MWPRTTWISSSFSDVVQLIVKIKIPLDNWHIYYDCVILLFDQDLANNPYFQHMLENYSSLMYQNINQPNQPKPGPFRGKPRDPGGPSWC